MALDSLAHTAPAIARQRQLHITPTSLSSDLRQFVASFYPPSTPDSSDSSAALPSTDEHPAPTHAVPEQRVLSIQEATATHNHEEITDAKGSQEQLQPSPPEQRVSSLPPQTDNDRPEQMCLPPVVFDAAIIAPACHTPEPLPAPIQHNPPPAIQFIAANVPFPKVPSSTKTRPVPPLTRSKTTASAAATTCSLNLAPDGSQLTYAKAIRGDEKAQWRKAEEEEFDRLFLSKTMTPIYGKDQPHDRRGDTSYYNPQIKEKYDSNGDKTFRIRGTIGGDRINYPGETSANTAAMPVVKLLLQSVISDDHKWMTLDIKDYYLNTPLPRAEYIRIQRKLIPDAVLKKHLLEPYLNNNSILFEVNQGMYGLPQAGYLAQQRLVDHLAKYDYHETSTPCLFRHSTNGTTFALVVDDFGVKYCTEEAAEHLISVLRELYEIKIDWTGAKYIGFTILFDREQKTVTLSMPAYIAKVLERFVPSKQSGAPSPSIYTPPSYGSRTQLATEDTSAALTQAAAKRIQEIVGSLLFYARGVDPTILPTVNLLASLQSSPTQNVADIADRLLLYCSRYPNNELVYHACDMTLFIQVDASYLSRSNARSVAGGICYLGNKGQPEQINGAIHAISTIIPSVVASAAEAEYAALFMLAQEGEYLRRVLDNMGYPQAPTLLLCDNQCAVGLATNSVKAKRTKSIDMRYHWIQDRVAQGHFQVVWRRGDHNLADFFTKALPVHTHQTLMRLLVRTPPSPGTTSQAPKARRAVRWSQTQQRQIERVC